MQTSLRRALADSHIAALAVAILLFFSLEGLSDALFYLVNHLVLFVRLAATYRSFDVMRPLAERDPEMLPRTLSSLIGTFAVIFSAWLLSRWIYRANPLRCLASYRDRVSRRMHG